TGKEIDALALDVTVDQLARLIGVAAHVGLQELRRLAAQLATELLDRQVEPVARFGAQRREGPRNIVGDADLDRVLRHRGARDEHRGQYERLERTHGGWLPALERDGGWKGAGRFAARPHQQRKDWCRV